jgi:hypothetical protein
MAVTLSLNRPTRCQLSVSSSPSNSTIAAPSRWSEFFVLDQQVTVPLSFKFDPLLKRNKLLRKV